MGATGVPLGLFPGMTWEELSFTLASGDVLVLYSDGVSEAQTAVFDEFGPERLADIVERQRERLSAEIIDAIVAAIDAFVEGAPQFDDITLMVIRRL
jgi:sigma-B regulation protein RsbU (phosphoserine phosphatase)